MVEVVTGSGRSALMRQAFSLLAGALCFVASAMDTGSSLPTPTRFAVVHSHSSYRFIWECSVVSSCSVIEGFRIEARKGLDWSVILPRVPSLLRAVSWTLSDNNTQLFEFRIYSYRGSHVSLPSYFDRRSNMDSGVDRLFGGDLGFPNSRASTVILVIVLSIIGSSILVLVGYCCLSQRRTTKKRTGISSHPRRYSVNDSIDCDLSSGTESYELACVPPDLRIASQMEPLRANSITDRDIGDGVHVLIQSTAPHAALSEPNFLDTIHNRVYELAPLSRSGRLVGDSYDEILPLAMDTPAPQSLKRGVKDSYDQFCMSSNSLMSTLSKFKTGEIQLDHDSSMHR